MRLEVNAYFAMLLLLASMLEGLKGFASAQPIEVVGGGEVEYQSNCAVCHGVEANGDGIMRRYLTVQSANSSGWSNPQPYLLPGIHPGMNRRPLMQTLIKSNRANSHAKTLATL